MLSDILHQTLVRMEGKSGIRQPIRFSIRLTNSSVYCHIRRGICGRLLNLAWKYQFTGMEFVKWILYLPVNLFYLAGTGMMRRMFLFRHGTDFLYHGWCPVVYLCDVCGNAGNDVSVSVPGKKDRSVAHQFSADAVIWIPDYL